MLRKQNFLGVFTEMYATYRHTTFTSTIQPLLHEGKTVFSNKLFNTNLEKKINHFSRTGFRIYGAVWRLSLPMLQSAPNQSQVYGL